MIKVFFNILKVNDSTEVEIVYRYSDFSKEYKSHNDINVISTMGVISGHQDGILRLDEHLLCISLFKFI